MKEKGLGDKVEQVIQMIAPDIAEKNKDCQSCKKKKIWLNNFGAIFS